MIKDNILNKLTINFTKTVEDKKREEIKKCITMNDIEKKKTNLILDELKRDADSAQGKWVRTADLWRKVRMVVKTKALITSIQRQSMHNQQLEQEGHVEGMLGDIGAGVDHFLSF